MLRKTKKKIMKKLRLKRIWAILWKLLYSLCGYFRFIYNTRPKYIIQLAQCIVYR